MRRFLLMLTLGVAVTSCGDQEKGVQLFSRIESDQSGIQFNNTIIESDSLNILEYEYIYNGGGVGVADFNNDGLQDIFFSGNMVDNKLYLNRGGLKFEDVSEQARISGDGRWCSGVAVVDINQDGWKDIYVSANTHWSSELRRNLLYINNTQEAGQISFVESASEYGLADDGFSVNSAFFDYDNDGDLDVIIINNEMQDKRNPSTYTYARNKRYPGRIDKLYRNDSDKTGPAFTDVSTETGIVYDGYSLGVNVTDLDRDGWKDIYITNDFISEDLLYMNNGDGTFSERAEDVLKHTCHSAMGNDVADINNDGMADIVALDMLPEDNYRKKTMLGPNNYTTFYYNRRYGYIHQYVRNVLQINQGSNPETGELQFSEVAMAAGIEATDWSWTPLVADFDLDGYRDLIVTNGFPKDVTDRDFIDYHASNAPYVDQAKLLARIPAVKIPNYVYRNIGGARFENMTKKWGLDLPSFSNGAAYADFDNDGDLDFVINNIDDEAFLYRNNSARGPGQHYLAFDFRGPQGNIDGLGAIVNYRSEGIFGTYEHSPYRGYLSTVSEQPIIGFGTDTVVSLEIIWPDGRVQKMQVDGLKRTVNLDYAQSAVPVDRNTTLASETVLSPAVGIDQSVVPDDDFIDFNFEPLLLRKYSQFGPGIAVGDYNMDGRDDYYVVGSAGYAGRLYQQQADGEFVRQPALPVDAAVEELSALFFDVDGDQDLDLYIAAGSNQFTTGDEKYRDILLLNESGQFAPSDVEFQASSTSCVRAADFDGDGDLDLFVGTRVVPGACPQSPSSFLLENRSSGGRVKLVTMDQPVLEGIGMVSDALWTDLNTDGAVDLLIAGEWMPITVLLNVNGNLENATIDAGLEKTAGWWNGITSGDYDNDGDIDYIVSNFGTNSTTRASAAYPVRVYVDDFDDNGAVDAIPSIYWPDTNGVLAEVAYHGRGDLFKELTRIKGTFQTHHEMGAASIEQVLSSEERAGAQIVEATVLTTSFLENRGDGTFNLSPMPDQMQWAPVYGMISEDVNSDGNLDILAVGNDYGIEVRTGRMDALNGLLMLGKGTGEFRVAAAEETAFHVPGNGKALAVVRRGDTRLLLASQNNDEIRAFEQTHQAWALVPAHAFLLSFLSAEGTQISIREVYHGSGFLSQSTRCVAVPAAATIMRIAFFDGTTEDLLMKEHLIQ